MKICKHCGETESSTFYNSRDTICKACDDRRMILWRAENPNKQREYNRTYQQRYSHTPRGRFARLKVNARINGNDFSLSLGEFVQWLDEQHNNCHYCGREFTNGNGRKHSMTNATIDRKDNKLGYNLDNIVFACRRCNIVKGNWFTEQQMLEIAHKYFR